MVKLLPPPYHHVSLLCSEIATTVTSDHRGQFSMLTLPPATDRHVFFLKVTESFTIVREEDVTST
jgi:hypothetical protein